MAREPQEALLCCVLGTGITGIMESVFNFYMDRGSELRLSCLCTSISLTEPSPQHLLILLPGPSRSLAPQVLTAHSCSLWLQALGHLDEIRTPKVSPPGPNLPLQSLELNFFTDFFFYPVVALLSPQWTRPHRGWSLKQISGNSLTVIWGKGAGVMRAG